MVKDTPQLQRYLLMLLVNDGWEARHLITDLARAASGKPDTMGILST